jgi:type I restriction enzyme S subunit
MEVKRGYRQTEVGVIPEEWEVSPFRNLFNITAGGDVDPKRSQSFQDAVHCYPIYSNALTNYGLYGYCSYAIHPANSITITARGVVGSANYRHHPYTAIGRVLVLHPKSEIAGIYFAEVINNRLKFANESTGVPQLTAPQISKYLLPVPPLPEQRAIATALSDVDALIAGLDKLITKKRDLKQAAMQQLLTGKTRLPGFSGKWEVVQAGDIGRFRGGNGFPTKFQGISSGQYPFFKVSDMNNEGNETFMKTGNNFIEEAVRKRLGATAFPPNTIVFAKVGAAIFLERKKILTMHSCVDNNMAGYVLFDSVKTDYRYIHYYLLGFRLSSLVSTTALPSLSGTVLNAIEIHLPPTRAEQTAIAEVLSDMDAEIATLEARLEKTRALKQGMMQELLTGRIRLV